MLYKISKESGKSQIAAVIKTTLADEGLYEVKDLSQWLAATPRLLAYRFGESEAPQIIACEVTISSDFRVDVLGVDTDGTLVVCEVKRDDKDPLNQGLQYCGRLFSMPTKELIDLVEKEYAKNGVRNGVAELAAKLELPEESTFSEIWDFGKRTIRLVTVAQDYSAQVLQTARWLASTGMRLSCIRFDCFKDGTNLYLLPQQILPSVETIESYFLQREAAHRQAVQGRTRNTLASLITSGKLLRDEKVFDINRNEIGIVRDDHIERVGDKEKCFNFLQLTGYSGSWSALVRRDGEFKTIGELQQLAEPPQPSREPPQPPPP